MSLDLSTIKFQVNTTELDTAVKKIEALGASVQGLATSIGKLDKETSDASKTQSQANLNNAKTEALNIKNAKALRDAAAASEELTAATKKRQSVEERQEAITRNMADGYSRGQASILATAEAAGEATDRLGELLKTQRAMSGQSPFDKTLGAATVFANELRVLTVANDLYNQDLGFTKNQLMELGREHVRMTEQFKIQGKSLAGLDAEFSSVVQSAQKVTQAENTMAASMKNADKATMDAGKANTYIENELQKVRFALQANNEELNRSTANSLVRFENALKKSGLTLDQQKLKIDEYRRSQIELQKTQKANQTDYITRAVGPQITDIIVGLSTGQSPLTVMMQQGGQLRDQFGMMGVAAKDMGDVMRNAMKGMASSVFDTGKAITTMLAGGMFDAGKAVVNYASSFLFVDKAMEKMRENIIGMSKDFDTAADNLAKFDRIAGGFGKVVTVGILALITTLAAVGVAAVQNIKLMNELSQTLVSVGASYGLTSSQVLEYSDAISGAGISTQGSIAAMTQMIKAGAGTAESLQSITLAAVQLEKAGGQSVEATSKMYADLAKDPVKALSELRINTGLVTEANMENIMSLVEQGKEIDAVREAGLIMTDALTQSTKLLYNDMSPLQQLWIDMKGSLTDVWNGVNDIATSSGVVIAFRVVWESVALVIKGVFNTIKGLSTAVVAVMHNDWTGAVNILKETFGTVADNYTDATEAVSKTTEAMTSGVKVQTEAVKKAQEQSLAEKERLLTASALKDTKEKDQKLNAKTLSQSEFITKALEDKNKLLGQNNKLEGKNLAMVQRVAKAEWESLQPKEKKAKLSDEQKAENKNLEDYIDLMNKSVGLNKDYNNVLDGLQTRKKNGKITEQEYVKAVEELIKQQKFYTDGLAQEEKAQKAAQKAAADHMKLVEEFTKIQTEFAANSLKNQEGIQQENSALKLRGDLLGKTAEEQKKINENYKLQGDISKINAKYDKERLELQQKYLKLQADGFDVDYDTWNAQINESVRQQGEEANLVWAGVAMNAAESMQKEFDAIKSSITDVIVTALFDGGKAGSKKLRDQVVQAFRNKITVVIDAAVNTLMGSAASSLLGGNKEGGIGTLSNVTSLASLASSIGTVGSQVVTGAMSLTNAIGTIGANATGTGISGLLASNAAYGTAAPTAMSTITGAIEAIPGWGWALMAGVAVAAMLEGGETRSGATYGTGANGKAVKLEGPSGGEIASTQVQKMFNTAKSSIEEMLTGFGSKAVLTGFTAGLESSEAGKGFAFAGGQINGVGFGEYKGRSGGQFAMGDKTTEQAVKDFELNLTQSILEGLQVTEDIPTSIAKLITDGLNGDEVKNLSQEAVNTILNSISTLTKSVNLFNSAMTHLPFEYLKNLSFDTADGLIAAGGGLESLMGNLSGFYDNFYTEAEKTSNLTNATSAAFAKLNITMPAINESTREWYRSEVERLGAMDLSVEANARAYASILGLQGAVTELAPAFEEVQEVVIELSEVTKRLQSEGASLQSQWNELALSSEELFAVQTEGMTDLQIAQFRANASLQYAIRSLNEVANANKTTSDLQISLLRAQGKEQEANYLQRTNELNSLTYAGRAAYLYNESLRDQIDLLNQAAALQAQQQSWQDQISAPSLSTLAERLSEAITTSGASPVSASDLMGLSLQQLKDYALDLTDDIVSKQVNKETLVLSAAEIMSVLPGAIVASLGTADPYGKLTETITASITSSFAGLPDGLAAWVGPALTGLTQGAVEALQGTWTDGPSIDQMVSDIVDYVKINVKDIVTTLSTKEDVSVYTDIAGPMTAFINALSNPVSSPSTVVGSTIDVLQEFNRALLEAQGDTSGLAEFDRKLSDAALIAQGWTQAQVDAVTAARTQTEISKGVNTWQERLNSLSEEGKLLNRVNQKQKDLAAAYSDTEKALIEQVYALEDVTQAAAVLKSATESLESAAESLTAARTSVASAFQSIEDAAVAAQSTVDSAKEAITQGYLGALDQQTQAQETINDLIRQSAEEMRGFADGIREFLLEMATTDIGANSASAQLKALQFDFEATAELARGGDKGAYGSITGKASNLLSAGKGQFSTALEFARFSSSIGNTLDELATIADGKAGPLAIAVDPMIKAQEDLLKAQEEVIKWTKAVNESGANTFFTIKDYADDWREAQAANAIAQSDLTKALELTAGINLKIETTLQSLRGLIEKYNAAQEAFIASAGVRTGVPAIPTQPTNQPRYSVTDGDPGGDVRILTENGVFSVSRASLATQEGTIARLNEIIQGSSNSSLAAAAADYGKSLGLPGFAIGTNYVPYDMPANIHQGERIIPAADNQELMQRLSSPMTQDNSELVLEIQRLNNRLATIESNTASTAGHAAKTARLLDRAMPDGDALATRTAEAI